MGAIAGSWAGLHGPGEKTIEKAGQSDPGLCEGFGEWKERGPGQRAAGRPCGVGAQGASPCRGGGVGVEGSQGWGRGQGSGRGLTGS